MNNVYYYCKCFNVEVCTKVETNQSHFQIDSVSADIGDIITFSDKNFEQIASPKVTTTFNEFTESIPWKNGAGKF